MMMSYSWRIVETGEEGTGTAYFGPYENEVLDAQERRGNRPIKVPLADGNTRLDYDFAKLENEP
jgi:hypothetical protein